MCQLSGIKDNVEAIEQKTQHRIMTPDAAVDKPDGAQERVAVRQAQRLRITFSQQGVLRYVGHLDVVRTWERALRRASIPLAYSEGFNPQPRLFFAAALPLGATGQREIVDVVLAESMAPEAFHARVQPHLPGLRFSRRARRH